MKYQQSDFPYKQRVRGSNPCAPTKSLDVNRGFFIAFTRRIAFGKFITFQKLQHYFSFKIYKLKDSENNVENITVDFYEVDAGWLRFKLVAGQQIYEGQFSHIFDPIDDLKHWLEAIAIGVQQTSFDFNPEGDEIKFNFEQLSCDEAVFSVAEVCDDGDVFITAIINRAQLVKAFYLGFLVFISSDNFISAEWEIQYLKERLCEMFNIDEEKLINQLAEYDRDELGKILFSAAPSFNISFPSAKNKEEELMLFVEMSLQDTDSPKGQPIQKTPVEWQIPDDYNYWPIAKKTEFVIECINESVHGYYGAKVNDFRSSIIENYLKDQI